MNKLAFVLFFSMFSIHAAAVEFDGLIHRAALVRGGFEQITLPANEVMGMLGTTYLIETIPNLYVGGAVYSALTGNRGGFFTIGPEVAWHQKLISQWEWESGLYAGAGGGGGATALVGGGLMIRPHLDLLWNGGSYRAGLSASRVYFPSGQILSDQLGIVLSSDADFSQLTAQFGAKQSIYPERGGVGFDRVLAVVGSYHGQILASSSSQMRIGLVGFRMEQMKTPNSYVGIEASGAASGGVAGYAEFLGTLGVEEAILNQRLVIGGRAALGMGGGGSVSVGGGALAKLGTYLTATVARNTHLALEGGYARAPDGQFRARYVAANLILDLDHPYATTGDFEVNQYACAGGISRYARTAHKDGSISPMDVLTLKVNRDLSDALYLSGQVHSAFRGKEGGYSAGLFGAGLRSPKYMERFSVGAEMLIGAAGGGAVDSSGGAIMAPSVYLDWQLDNQFGLRLSSGKVKSVAGELNSQTLDLSIQFAYAAIRR